MSLYREFCISSAIGSRACELAKAWKAAKPTTRNAACKQMGDSFQIAVTGTRSIFEFHKDGSVKTINQPRTRNWDEPAWAKTQHKYEVDPDRKVVGFAYGRPIYG